MGGSPSRTVDGAPVWQGYEYSHLVVEADKLHPLLDFCEDPTDECYWKVQQFSVNMLLKVLQPWGITADDVSCVFSGSRSLHIHLWSTQDWGVDARAWLHPWTNCSLESVEDTGDSA